MSYLFPRPGRALAALLALALTGLGACKSAQPLLKATPSAAISQRLPPLLLAADAGPLIDNDGALPDDPLELFQAEMRRNVLEPADSATTHGYARLRVTKVHTTRTGRGLQAAQMLLLMTPSLLGVPLEWYHTELEVEVQVLDASGQVLGTYTGQGSSHVKVAAYHGYAQQQAPRLADVLALRKALSRIRPQLDTAATRLRPLLLQSAPDGHLMASAAAAPAFADNGARPAPAPGEPAPVTPVAMAPVVVTAAPVVVAPVVVVATPAALAAPVPARATMRPMAWLRARRAPRSFRTSLAARPAQPTRHRTARLQLAYRAKRAKQPAAAGRAPAGAVADWASALPGQAGGTGPGRRGYLVRQQGPAGGSRRPGQAARP